MCNITSYLTPKFMASATATMVMPSIMLLHILATNPEPAGPQCTHLEPMEPSSHSASTSVFLSPPTMNVKVPFSAPTTPVRVIYRYSFLSTIHRIRISVYFRRGTYYITLLLKNRFNNYNYNFLLL